MSDNKNVFMTQGTQQDTPVTNIADFSEDQLIKVYVYEQSNKKRGQIRVSNQGYSIVAIQNVKQSTEPSASVLKSDANGDLYFELLAEISHDGELLKSSKNNLDGLRFINKQSISGITNNFVVGDGDSPKFCTVNEPFNYDAYMKGDQAVYYMKVQPSTNFENSDIATVSTDKALLMDDTTLTELSLHNITDWESKFGRLIFKLGGYAIFEPKVFITGGDYVEATMPDKMFKLNNKDMLVLADSNGTNKHDIFSIIDDKNPLKIKWKTISLKYKNATQTPHDIKLLITSEIKPLLLEIINSKLIPLDNWLLNLTLTKNLNYLLGDGIMHWTSHPVKRMVDGNQTINRVTTNDKQPLATTYWIKKNGMITLDNYVELDHIVKVGNKNVVAIDADNSDGSFRFITDTGAVFISDISTNGGNYALGYHEITKGVYTLYIMITDTVDIYKITGYTGVTGSTITYDIILYPLGKLHHPIGKSARGTTAELGNLNDIFKGIFNYKGVHAINGTTYDTIGAATIEIENNTIKIPTYDILVEFKNNKDREYHSIYKNSSNMISDIFWCKDLNRNKPPQIGSESEAIEDLMSDIPIITTKQELAHSEIIGIYGDINCVINNKSIVDKFNIIVNQDNNLYTLDVTRISYLTGNALPKITFGKYKYIKKITNNRMSDTHVVNNINLISDLDTNKTYYNILDEFDTPNKTFLAGVLNVEGNTIPLNLLVDKNKIHEISQTDVSDFNKQLLKNKTAVSGWHSGIHLETESHALISSITAKGLIGPKLEPIDLDFKSNEMMCPILANITDITDKVTLSMPWFNRETTSPYYRLKALMDNNDGGKRVLLKDIMKPTRGNFEKPDAQLIYDMILMTFLISTKMKVLPVETSGNQVGHIKANVTLGVNAQLKPALLGGQAAHAINDGLFKEWQETYFLDDFDERVLIMKQTINMLSKYISSQYATSGGNNPFNSKREPWYLEMLNTAIPTSICGNAAGKPCTKSADNWILKTNVIDKNGNTKLSDATDIAFRIRSNYFEHAKNGKGLTGIVHTDVSNIRILRGGGTHKLEKLPNILTASALPIVPAMLDPNKSESLEYMLYLPTQHVDAVKRLYLDSEKINVNTATGGITKKFNLITANNYKDMTRVELEAKIKEYAYQQYGTRNITILHHGSRAVATKVVHIKKSVKKGKYTYPRWITDGTKFESFNWNVIDGGWFNHPRVWSPVNRIVSSSGSRYSDHTGKLDEIEKKNIVHNLYSQFPVEHVKILNTNIAEIGFNYEKYSSNYRWWNLDFQAEVNIIQYLDVEITIDGSFTEISDANRSIEYDKPQWKKYTQSLNRTNVEIFKRDKVKYTLYSAETIEFISQINARILFNDTITIYLNDVKIELPAINQSDEKLTNMEILLF